MPDNTSAVATHVDRDTACQTAGVGGEISRLGALYLVGEQDGAWTLLPLSVPQSAMGPQPAARYVSDDWTVTRIISPETGSYLTTDGRTVTVRNDHSCGTCGGQLDAHIERMACPTYPGETFRAWGTNDTLAAEQEQRPAPRFTVGQRVSFSPGGYGSDTGTVSEVQDARDREFVEHAYVIELPDGITLHRWENHGSESVTAVEPAAHVITNGNGTELHNLFIAVALAGGPGGIIRNTGAERACRILRCDSVESGEVDVETIGLDNPAVLPLIYSSFTDATWSVVTGAETPVEPSKPEPVAAAPRRTIPRDMDELTAMRADAERVAEMFPTASVETGRYLRALDQLEGWLHGGKKQRSGHALAGVEDPDESEALYDETRVHSIGLCGEYEGIVCTTFGWHPRRGETSSMMRYAEAWKRDVTVFEQRNEHLNAAALIELWLSNYEPGGLFNMAVVDHIEGHLESHKVEDANELLESFGWTTVPVQRDYEIRVRITREVTVTEEAYITLTRTATNEDDALEVDRYEVSDYVSYADWEEYDRSVDSDFEVDTVELDD